jgi:hypothetical protein
VDRILKTKEDEENGSGDLHSRRRFEICQFVGDTPLEDVPDGTNRIGSC